MRYLNWLLRAVLFLALLGLALKNDQPVTLRYFLSFEWHTSLAIVLLIFFAAGVVIGIVAMFANVLQQRREIARLQCNDRTKNKLDELSEKSSSIQTS
ncbi:MAG: LapA family protein [Gallionella sp.]|nr:LapA family protein [Gallionella sp.]